MSESGLLTNSQVAKELHKNWLHNSYRKGTMKPELLGMSNEELVKWAVSHSALEEKELRKLLPGIEAFCATAPISVYEYVEELVKLSNAGVRAAKAGRALRKQLCG